MTARLDRRDTPGLVGDERRLPGLRPQPEATRGDQGAVTPPGSRHHGPHRFQREAEILATVTDPGIAAIYSVEEHGGASYLVMEFVAGETLAERLARGPLSLERTLELARQIARARIGARPRRRASRPQAGQRHARRRRQREDCSLTRPSAPAGTASSSSRCWDGCRPGGYRIRPFTCARATSARSTSCSRSRASCGRSRSS